MSLPLISPSIGLKLGICVSLLHRLNERMAAGTSTSVSAGAMRGGLNEEKDKEREKDRERGRDSDGIGNGYGGDEDKDKYKDKEKDFAIGNIAILRAQRAMADRLSSTGRTNLPKGVMLHDNPLIKTNAFLSQMPALT